MTSSSAYARYDLTGRVAVVTGAARGIGAATADLLEMRGATVWRVDRDVTTDTDSRLIHADVSSPDACAEAGAVVALAHDRLDILVNNAGVGAFGMGIAEATVDDWHRVIGVNATSVFAMSKAMLPLLEAAGTASIVNVSSVHALATSAGVAPYAASKGAVLALTRSMAIDLGPRGIRVACVLPGATDTDMLRNHARVAGMTYEELGFSLDPSSFPRVCSPDEVAEVIAFAASPAGSAVTGSALLADGGLLAGF